MAQETAEKNTPGSETTTTPEATTKAELYTVIETENGPATAGVNYDPESGKYNLTKLDPTVEKETTTHTISSEDLANNPELAQAGVTERENVEIPKNSGDNLDTQNFRETVIPESMTPGVVIPENATEHPTFQIQVTADALKKTFDAHYATALPALSEQQVKDAIGDLSHLGLQHEIEKSEGDKGFAVVLKDVDSFVRIPHEGYYDLLPDFKKPAIAKQ